MARCLRFLTHKTHAFPLLIAIVVLLLLGLALPTRYTVMRKPILFRDRLQLLEELPVDTEKAFSPGSIDLSVHHRHNEKIEAAVLDSSPTTSPSELDRGKERSSNELDHPGQQGTEDEVAAMPTTPEDTVGHFTNFMWADWFGAHRQGLKMWRNSSCCSVC